MGLIDCGRDDERHRLEVECQVGGDDGDVHEVDDDVVLAAVQILVDVQ